MAKMTKRYTSDAGKVDVKKTYTLDEAVGILKGFKAAKFDQTVDLCVWLGIDPKQADQLVRGSVSLPHGTGKTKRVIAFCAGDKVAAATAAGAIEAGGEELVKKIEGGWMDFDVAVATPDMMKIVSKLGKTLGPRGLMPSPKAGTVSADVAAAVKEYSAGKVNFKNDTGGNIHVPIGKLSFDAGKIRDNAQAMLDLIQRLKPSAAKGQFVKRVTLTGTMTPGVRVAVGAG